MEESAEEDELNKRESGSSFRTFDATDYSSIATIDIKRNIYDLAVDHKDNFIAIIEQAIKPDFAFNSPDNVCKLYEIGRSKEEDEEAEDDEEEDDGNDLDDSEDDDDVLDATDDFEHGYGSSDNTDSEMVYDSGSDEEDDDSDEESDDEEHDHSDNSDDYEDVDSEDEEQMLNFIRNNF